MLLSLSLREAPFKGLLAPFITSKIKKHNTLKDFIPLFQWAIKIGYSYLCIYKAATLPASSEFRFKKLTRLTDFKIFLDIFSDLLNRWHYFLFLLCFFLSNLFFWEFAHLSPAAPPQRRSAIRILRCSDGLLRAFLMLAPCLAKKDTILGMVDSETLPRMRLLAR